MAAPSSEGLRVASKRLRNADPQLWLEFIAEMEKWTGQRLLDMAGAPPDAVFYTQGMAQASRALLRIFNECHLEPGKKPGA